MLFNASILLLFIFFFFFNDTATTEIYTLSLHDALPICFDAIHRGGGFAAGRRRQAEPRYARWRIHSRKQRRGKNHRARSEEHTSELQSQSNLVCRLLLEKKKTNDVLCLPPTSS